MHNTSHAIDSIDDVDTFDGRFTNISKFEYYEDKKLYKGSPFAQQRLK